MKPRLVEEDNRTFTEVLIGKGHEKELEILSGDIMGKAENHPLRKMDDFGKKVMETLPRNQVGGDHGNFPSMYKANVIPVSIAKEMPNSIKEVDSWLSKLEWYGSNWA